MSYKRLPKVPQQNYPQAICADNVAQDFRSIPCYNPHCLCNDRVSTNDLPPVVVDPIKRASYLRKSRGVTCANCRYIVSERETGSVPCCGLAIHDHCHTEHMMRGRRGMPPSPCRTCLDDAKKQTERETKEGRARNQPATLYPVAMEAEPLKATKSLKQRLADKLRGVFRC
ncbi:hypothetical protein ST47_g3713 [Ascochyta rabiei]|uniref:Uncharacterized protein n=1 Tax=Didymella rabiei TaxID=5454 RepID=A0A163H3L9_DIDRA|nr:hypothetical protein ST47_g3713 [Ascochyta rabiei]